MTDMLIVAFKADITRISTFMIGREGSTRAYPEIGVADGHHPLTHHMGNMDMLEKVRQINVLHATAMAAFVKKMKERRKAIPIFWITLSLFMAAAYLMAMSHLHARSVADAALWPRPGLYLPGRHDIYQRETPVANLFATMLDRVGVRPEHVGDSTGELAGLTSLG